jgi:hypothetical protein
MCFKQQSSKPPPTPAPAPAPPAAPPAAPEIGSARVDETKGAFGQTTPNLRIDRSLSGGGVGTGGSGVRM